MIRAAQRYQHGSITGLKLIFHIINDAINLENGVASYLTSRRFPSWRKNQVTNVS